MNKPVIYTLGHSTHPAEYFLKLLTAYSVNCLVDVRSIAASRFKPQYNKEALSNFLKTNNIQYLHFAAEFGARQIDPTLLDDDGKVDFGKVRQSQNFKRGIERLWQGVDKQYTIALMCAESEPLDCHRFSMISVALQGDGFEVKHILNDGTLKTNADLEGDLLKKYEKKIPKPGIFEPQLTLDGQLKAAYRLQNKEIAYSPALKHPGNFKNENPK